VPKGSLGGQQIIEHDLVVDETEGKLPGFLEQMVQELKVCWMGRSTLLCSTVNITAVLMVMCRARQNAAPES